MSPTKQQIRQLRRDNAQYPVSLTLIPRHQWSPEEEGRNALLASPRIAVYRSRAFLVQVFKEPDGIIRLSVKMLDKAWSGNVRAVACPHCHKVLLPEDFDRAAVGMCSRDIELARRKREDERK